MKQYIAIDLGASSGRIMLFDSDGSYRECSRFSTVKCHCNGRLCWDHVKIWESIRQGLLELAPQLSAPPCGISCDSWAQDTVLLDNSGEVLTNPVCYLDGQLKGASLRLEKLGLSGFADIHTVCQLTVQPENIIRNCAYLLHIADYVNYQLSGVPRGNYSMYSVGKLLDSAGDLNRELLGKLNIPETIFPEVCSEKVIGKLDNSWPDILQGVPVISGISHDTAAAFYSLAPQENEAAVIFGTWLMCGVLQEASQPIPQNVKVMGINYQYSARHASAPGLWAFNQCVEAWKKQGVFPGFAEFDAAVSASDYSGSFQAAWSDKPLQIEDVAKSLLAQGFALPQTLGDYGKALNSGMLKHLESALAVLQSNNRPLAGVVIGGGGINNRPLMAMLEQKLALNCRCGNVEASAWGNVLAQIHALNA